MEGIIASENRDKTWLCEILIMILIASMIWHPARGVMSHDLHLLQGMVKKFLKENILKSYPGTSLLEIQFSISHMGQT